MEYQTIRNCVMFKGLGREYAAKFLREQLEAKEFRISRVYDQGDGHDGDGIHTAFRNSTQAVVDPMNPLVQLACEATRFANQNYFHVNVSQYCRENSLVKYDVGGFFKDHSDIIWGRQPNNIDKQSIRKLTSIMLINDPDEFEGGTLHMWDDNTIYRTDFEMGDLIVFPSYVRHVVKPVTKGVRYSLVMWSLGYF